MKSQAGFKVLVSIVDFICCIHTQILYQSYRVLETAPQTFYLTDPTPITYHQS